MTQNIEKLLGMLSLELIRVRESGSLAEQHAVKLEMNRMIKTDYTKLCESIDQGYLDALEGQEEAVINGWVVSYRGGSSFRLDTQKLLEHFGSEEEMKNAVYSHKPSQPSLKFKPIKQ